MCLSDGQSKFFGEYNHLKCRWSVKKDVPSLGDENTKWSDVQKFYKFWKEFKSWRDFTFRCEHDIKEGQSRDEKRAIEKENEKIKKKFKKEEQEQIKKIVGLCDEK